MATRLNPYFILDGTTREAMDLYAAVFGGQVDLHTFGEFGMEGQGSDRVMHASLETSSGLTLMAADTPPGAAAPAGSAVSVSLSGEDDAELRGYWDGLSEGATVTMPLEKQMWGDVYGMLTDRFGIEWMVNIAQPQG